MSSFLFLLTLSLSLVSPSLCTILFTLSVINLVAIIARLFYPYRHKFSYINKKSGLIEICVVFLCISHSVIVDKGDLKKLTF